MDVRAQEMYPRSRGCNWRRARSMLFFLFSNQYSQPLGLSFEHFAEESMGFSYFTWRFGSQEMGVKEGQG